jgi:outer membrane lipoprotein-sorting protein
LRGHAGVAICQGMSTPRKAIIGRRAALAGAAGMAVAALLPRAASAALPAGDAETVARVEEYLNSIRTLQARFVQTATDGSHAEGTLYLQRPGRLRIDYAPPARLQIYATGMWLIMVDEELKEVNQLPLSATPASVLVRNRIELSGDIAVQSLERDRGALRIGLTRTDEPGAGTLTFVFSEQPLALRQWSVTDSREVTTRVALLDPEINIDIPRSVFVFTPPDWAYPG